MTPQLVTVGPRKPADLLDPPFRAFIGLQTTSSQDHGWRKLKLLSSGRDVGYAVFRWREVTRHEQEGRPYFKAKGELYDLMIPRRFSDMEIIEMIRQAMERAAWKFYIYEPTDPNSYEPEKFEEWIQHQLGS